MVELHNNKITSNRSIAKCVSKKKFYSVAQVSGYDSKYNLNWYLCPEGVHWHLTSKDQQPTDKVTRNELIILIDHLCNLISLDKSELEKLATKLHKEAEFIRKGMY